MGERVWACRRCGKRFAKRRSLTRNGYCSPACGIEVMIEHNLGLAVGDPAVVDAWAAKIKAKGERERVRVLPNL